MFNAGNIKLNEKAFALASGTVLAILAVICAALIGLWPASTMRFYGWAAHFDMMSFVPLRQVTFFNFIGGVVVMFVAGYVVGWVFALLYNRFSGKEATA